MDQLIRKARSQLLLDEPFFGTLALKLVLEETTDTDTAATDGKRLFYNPKFTNKLTPQTLRGLIAHEVMHCVFCHHIRRQKRDPMLWNIATDYAINLHLLDCGFILPDGALVDEQYRDMTAETIYNQIQDDAQQCPWGMVLDAKGGVPAEIETDWRIAVTEAHQVAKAAGKLPKNAEHFINEIIDPIVDWRTVLWPFCQSISNDDYSWRKPNRAYISEDEYLPSLYNETAGHIAVIMDSSGSCTDYYQQFLSEMAAIHSDLTPEKITIIHCDCEVAKTYEVDRYDEFPFNKVHGGGGTRFKPAFDWLNEHAQDLEAAVYLTDLEARPEDFGEEPHYPVLWVSTTKRQAPWGKTCQIELN